MKKVHLMLAGLCFVPLTACINPTRPDVRPVETVSIPVAVEAKTVIPPRPALPVLGLPASALPDVRARAYVSTIAALVGHVKSLECLLAPYASNAQAYVEACANPIDATAAK
jgi:hypothetical protein